MLMLHTCKQLMHILMSFFFFSFFYLFFQSNDVIYGFHHCPIPFKPMRVFMIEIFFFIAYLGLYPWNFPSKGMSQVSKGGFHLGILLIFFFFLFFNIS
jgi:hypothetical protein